MLDRESTTKTERELEKLEPLTRRLKNKTRIKLLTKIAAESQTKERTLKHERKHGARPK
jgi:hypothetical protein